MAIALQRGERDPQRIVDAIIQLIEGRQNSIGDVTLAPGATSTVVDFTNCSKDCRVLLFAQTANAALAVASSPGVYVDISSIDQGTFTITHANAGTTDRTFSFLCIGG